MPGVQPNQWCHDDYREATERLFYLVSLESQPMFPQTHHLRAPLAQHALLYDTSVRSHW